MKRGNARPRSLVHGPRRLRQALGTFLALLALLQPLLLVLPGTALAAQGGVYHSIVICTLEGPRLYSFDAEGRLLSRGEPAGADQAQAQNVAPSDGGEPEDGQQPFEQGMALCLACQLSVAGLLPLPPASAVERLSPARGSAFSHRDPFRLSNPGASPQAPRAPPEAA